jgi:hypothetical protein
MQGSMHAHPAAVQLQRRAAAQQPGQGGLLADLFALLCPFLILSNRAQQRRQPALQRRARAAVERVAQNRRAQVRAVRAQLVLAPCMRVPTWL